MQLEDVSEEEEKEEEVGKDTGEYEGSWVTKTEIFCSREVRGKEGGEVSSDSLSKVMISIWQTWLGWKLTTKRETRKIMILGDFMTPTPFSFSR